MEFTLNNGVVIPAVGLGTFRSRGDEVYDAVLSALKTGYRHIDTAAAYGNEEEVGRAIKDSGVPREEVFVTTKLWLEDHGYMSARRALRRSLGRLGLDYVDLYLIHWPRSYQENADTYKAFESLYREGYTRAIGVSNFNFHHLEHLLKTAEITPQVNQYETHVFLQNPNLQSYCMKNGIFLEAYAPILSKNVKDLLEDETLVGIAENHDKTPVQIALRYLYEREIIAIPKSASATRQKENFDIFDFSLSDDDYQTIRGMNRGRKTFPDPDNFFY